MEMEVDYKKIIRQNYEFLREIIEPEPLADYLFKEKKITSSQHESILEQKGRAAAKECLKILKNSRWTFLSFIEFLKLDDARGFILEHLEIESESARGEYTGESKQEMVEEIRVVMFGKTGVGKSKLGNNIIDKKNVFPSCAAANSVTKEAKRGERMICRDYKLVLVDTPGLFDTETKDNMETAKILSSTVKETKPGPHVFIFVLSINSRYTTEEKAAIEFLKDLLGIHVTNYLIIVFTGKDTIDYDDIDFEKYIDKAGDDLKDLLSQCQGRVAINNRASPAEVTRSVDDILQLIKHVYLQNEKQHYTDELLEEAQKKHEEKLRLQEEEAHKRERELEEEKKKLEQKIDDLSRGQEKAQKQYEGLKKDTENQKQFLLNECDKLRKEMEKNNEKINSLIWEKEKLQKKYEDSKKQNELLKELDEKIKNLLKNNEEKDASINKLLTKLKELQTDKDEELKEIREEMRKDKKAAQAKIDELEEQRKRDQDELKKKKKCTIQ